VASAHRPHRDTRPADLSATFLIEAARYTAQHCILRSLVVHSGAKEGGDGSQLWPIRLFVYRVARHQQEAVAIFRGIGDRLGEARTLGNLSRARQRQGRYQEAAACLRQSLELAREIGDRWDGAWALARLGVVDLRPGRYQHAARYLQQALALCLQMGDIASESEILANLGDAYLGLGRYEQAAGHFERALATFREIGDPILEGAALNGLADVLSQTGHTDRARAHHATALRLASETNCRSSKPRAHNGPARAYHADGDSHQARHDWQEALTRYAAIGAPEARDIRARLAMTGDGHNDDEPVEEREEEHSGTTVPFPPMICPAAATQLRPTARQAIRARCIGRAGIRLPGWSVRSPAAGNGGGARTRCPAPDRPATGRHRPP
jgi:tetratricopeptide (TPR) repeat protein